MDQPLPQEAKHDQYSRFAGSGSGTTPTNALSRSGSNPETSAGILPKKGFRVKEAPLLGRMTAALRFQARRKSWEGSDEAALSTIARRVALVTNPILYRTGCKGLLRQSPGRQTLRHLRPSLRSHSRRWRGGPRLATAIGSAPHNPGPTRNGADLCLDRCRSLRRAAYWGLSSARPCPGR